MIRLTRACALCALLFAVSPAKSLLVLPVTGQTENAADMVAVNRLFREAVEGRYGGTILPVPPSLAACGERECALAAAREAGADEVVFSNFYHLGARWLFSANIVRADGSRPFTQRLTVASIEDMEAVTQRMADAVIGRSTTEDVASLDNVTEWEEKDNQTRRRRSSYSTGLALGYLFPVNGGFNYLEADANNPSSLYSETNYLQIPRFSWLNAWEFRNNMALGLELSWGAPHVFGGDLNLTYLMGRGDFSVFVGGGTGFHNVREDEDPARSGHRNSGPSANAQAGLLLFRTYRINVLMRVEYLTVFNSDLDQGIAADVGIIFHGK